MQCTESTKYLKECVLSESGIIRDQDFRNDQFVAVEPEILR